MPRSAPTIVLLALVIASAPACLMTNPSLSSYSGIRVVAAEDQWGSIAAQLGDGLTTVTDVIRNPNTDPHSYEPTVADARDLADAQVVIENGIGYDPWAERLLAADPADGRIVIDVGDVVGVPDGGNPHQWYSPRSVRLVID